MKMFIDGRWCDASDGATMNVLNSATSEVIDTVPRATKADVDAAIAAAQDGKKLWAATPVHERSRILQACADAIDAGRESLARAHSIEMGKTIVEARAEIESAAHTIRAYAEAAKHQYGHSLPSSQPGMHDDIVFTRREPLGVVACISPFNYPVSLCTHKFAPALAAGNAVIIKPASDNPLIILKIVEICIDSGIPGNVMQVITGGGAEVGDQLSGSGLIDALSLTGSTEVGVHVAKVAAKTLKSVFLELGGNDPFIVFEDADPELAAALAVAGRTRNAGQTCHAPKRFIVHRSLKDRFVQSLIEQLKEIEILSPQDEKARLGALISERAAKVVHGQVQLSVQQGAQLVYGGEIVNKAHYVPAVLDSVTRDMDVAGNMEIFGPVFPVIAFDTETQAIDIANNTMFGLQSSVITPDVNRAMRVASQIQAGAVAINGSGLNRHVDQPFGGYKMSGVGREGVSVTLDEFSQEKTYVMRNVLAG